MSILISCLFLFVFVAGYIGFKAIQNKRTMRPTISPSSPPPLALSTESTQVAEDEFSEIVLQDGNGNSLISVSVIPKTQLELKRLDINTTKISKLGPILGALPTLAVSQAAHGDSLMRVIVNGVLAPSKQIEGALMPMVRGENGKFVEQAKLLKPGNLQNIAKLAAVWQIASVVVAQGHLADIGKKLKAIESSIGSIESFLKEQRLSVITGTLEYLSQVHSAIQIGELNPIVRDKLESIEIDLLRVQNHLQNEVKILHARISSIEDPNMFGAEGLKDAIKKHQMEIGNSLKCWMLCVNTRIANWQVLSAYPEEYEIKLIRKQSIVDAIQVMAQLIPEMEENMGEKIGTVRATFFNFDQTLTDYRIELGKNFDDVVKEHDNVSQGARVSLDQIEKRLVSYETTPLVLGVRIDNGQVVEAYELDNSAL